MMKKSKMVGSVGLALTILFYVTIFMLPTEAEAKTKVVAIEGISYNVNSSMADNLKSLIGKKVYVTLDSGKTFAGVVKEVGNHLMHLEKLDGKDYFDALLRIENISAIDTRFRNIQR
jgi:small nuclear ribonucleoprotein (snRNP)-like protein